MSTLLHLPFGEWALPGAGLLPDMSLARRALSATGVSLDSGSAVFSAGGNVYMPRADYSYLSRQTADLSIGAWVYNGRGGTIFVFDDPANVNTGCFHFRLTADGALQLYAKNHPAYNGGASFTLTTSNRIAVNTWGFVGVSRASGTWYLSIDGVITATGSNPLMMWFSTDGNAYIGKTLTNTHLFVGRMDDFHFDDTALYTTNFTPPGPIPYTPWTVGFSRAGESSRYSPYEDGPTVFGLVPPVRRLIENTEYGGRGTVVGTVERKGSPNAPLARRVRLFRDRDAICVGEQWSNAAGQFAFPYLDQAETYTALAYDHTGEFESVCASRLLAEVD